MHAVDLSYNYYWRHFENSADNKLFIWNCMDSQKNEFILQICIAFRIYNYFTDDTHF